MDRLLRNRLEASAEDFDVDLGTRDGRAGLRQANFRFHEFLFQVGKFIGID